MRGKIIVILDIGSFEYIDCSQWPWIESDKQTKGVPSKHAAKKKEDLNHSHFISPMSYLSNTRKTRSPKKKMYFGTL